MIEFRPSTAADADSLLRVWRNAVDSSHEFLSADDRAAIDPLVADYVGSADLTVATLDGRPVAFMGVTGNTIDSLFIDPHGQGRGIGRLLVERVAQPTLVDVNEQNEPAVAFYRHLGFAVIGRSDLDGEGRPYPLLHLRRA
jgi:putative acetyltransferase